MKKTLISVIAPMYNEEDTVDKYCQVTLEVFAGISDKYNFEIVLVDDGSKDGTLERMYRIQEVNPDTITIVGLSRNFGLEGAVNAGLRKASGDAVIIMDADLQDPPELIPELVRCWEIGYDVVTASRPSRKTDTLFKRVTAIMFYRVLDSLSGKLKLEKGAANFRLLSRRAVNQILALLESNGVFRVEVPFIGMKSTVISYLRNERNAGKTKYNLKSMIPYALDSLTSISVVPLRKIFFSVPIAGLFVIAFILGIIFSEGIWRVGYMVCLLISFLFLILFACIALIAEYIGQIMTEAKGRPMSIIYEYKPCKNVGKDDSNEVC